MALKYLWLEEQQEQYVFEGGQHTWGKYIFNQLGAKPLDPWTRN